MSSRRTRAGAGFSLVEVVLALGVSVFALLAVIALLPLGLKNNSTSVEELRSLSILSSVEADLRNSRLPAGTGGPQLSAAFGLPLPYRITAEGRLVLNPELIKDTVYTSALGESEKPAASPAEARYQASVVYLSAPGANSFSPIQARLIVSWPPISAATIADLTNPARVSGFVDKWICFEVP